jgi:hypothetical protein
MELQNSKELNEMHDKAMEYAGLADLAKRQGDYDEVLRLYEQALEMEQHVALQVAKTTLEPSRSGLLRSAASLAYCCGHYQDSIDLVVMAMKGHPPRKIIEELHELWNNLFEAMLHKWKSPITQGI